MQCLVLGNSGKMTWGEADLISQFAVGEVSSAVYHRDVNNDNDIGLK